MKLYLLAYNIFDATGAFAPAGFTIQAEDDDHAKIIAKRIRFVTGILRYGELYDISTDTSRKLEWSQ
jgi:hypothetical protein